VECLDPPIAECAAQDENEDPIIEKYYTWKKNTPILYDLIMTANINWPSYTVQWFPDKLMPPQRSCTHRLLLGTSTSGQDDEYLKIAHISTPAEAQKDELLASESAGEIDGETGGYSKSNSAWKVSNHMRVRHRGEVQRARYMPQNPFVVATKGDSEAVNIFYLPKHPSEPANDEVKPQLTLGGHDKDGFALAWNVFSEGLLLSGATDGKICLWDVQAVPKDEAPAVVMPQTTFTGAHRGSVEAVDWSPLHEFSFCSVGDDGMAVVWDRREANSSSKIEAHAGEARSVAYNHYNQHLLATGGDDKVVALWDLRRVDKPLLRMSGHTEEVACVQWSPFHEDVLASGSLDQTVNLWDISQAAQGLEPLVFTHAGHRGGVQDLSWNQHDPWTLASVGQDAELHIWRPAERLLAY